MKTSSRLPIVASLVAALCLAPAAFAKPKGYEDGPEGYGKKGKHWKGGKHEGHDGVRGPGGFGIVIVQPRLQPPQPQPLYHRDYRRSSDNSDSTVASVQRELRTRGYYNGAVDGDAGRGTRAAIRGFREDNGMGSTSNIDGSLLRALGL